jgi:hypothetical protein
LGLKGGVIGLFHIAAFILPLGESLTTGVGAVVVAGLQVYITTFPASLTCLLPPTDTELQPDGSVLMSDPGHRCYNDLPEDQRNHWVSLLRPNPAVAHSSPLTYVAYKHYPVAYLYCENDQAIPVQFQRSMVKKVRAMGVMVREYNCDSGHSPYLSQPVTVLKAVESWLKLLSKSPEDAARVA